MEQCVNNPAIKGKRTKNWNNDEKKFLIVLCSEFIHIIGNKGLDTRSAELKNDAWTTIHDEFCNQFGKERSCLKLKAKWWRLKAYARKEIFEYNNRLALYGAEVADRKKPSAFIFEIWDIMREAEKASLEEKHEYREDARNQDEEHGMDDNRTPPQATNGDEPPAKRPRSSSSIGNADELLQDPSMNAAAAATGVATDENGVNTLNNLNELNGCAVPAAASCFPMIGMFLEMQRKEHMMRMKILEVQRQSAQYNREIMDICKTLAEVAGNPQ